MFKLKGFASSATSLKLNPGQWEEPWPRTPVVETTIICLRLRDLPSSPCWTTGIVISGHNGAPASPWYIMWSGFEFRYKLQNLLRVACMTAMSLHPTKCSKRSYWTRYVSQADILTYGKSFLLSKSILEIGTGNDWPYLRNTAWQSLSLFFGFTRPSCLRAVDSTRVTRACLMTSLQETSASNGNCTCRHICINHACLTQQIEITCICIYIHEYEQVNEWINK